MTSTTTKTATDPKPAKPKRGRAAKKMTAPRAAQLTDLAKQISDIGRADMGPLIERLTETNKLDISVTGEATMVGIMAKGRNPTEAMHNWANKARRTVNAGR